MPSLSPLSSLGKVMLQLLLINPSQIGLSLVAQKVDSVIHRIERAQLVSLILIRWIVIYLAPVAQKLDSAIHRLNHFPADKY